MEENNFNYKKIFDIENRTRYFPHFLVCLFFISVIVFSLLIIGEKSLIKKNYKTNIPNAFASVNLEAKGVVVWDVTNNRELFSKNADEPLPLASLTKVMTAVTTDGRLDDNQKIKITREDLSPQGDSGLLVGDIWKAKDLRDFTLITSSNDGACALAAVAEAQILNSPPYNPGSASSTNAQAEFIKNMNETAVKIGLTNSKFFNENGLDESAEKGGAYGSAKDMALLFQYALKNYPQILEATRYKNLQFTSATKKYNAENTNKVIDQIPGILASKTGYTDLAGGNLVVAFDAGLGRPIIISVLGSSEQGRFSDVLQLVSATLKQLPNL
jgi:serine-type D-Ala-D-Ala carboxypeptidase (penicillin-binding protein 5/6)